MSLNCRRSIALDETAADEIDQVRLHRAPGGAAQPGLQPDVQSSEYRVDLPDTGPQAVKNTGLALAPVRDEGGRDPAAR